MSKLNYRVALGLLTFFVITSIAIHSAYSKTLQTVEPETSISEAQETNNNAIEKKDRNMKKIKVRPPMPPPKIKPIPNNKPI